MRPVALLVAALLAGALAPYPAATATARNAVDCAGPTLAVAGHGTPPLLRSGSDVRVTGEYFVDGCDDVGGSRDGALGCANDDDREKAVPLADVEMLLRQDGRTWRLGRADATGLGRIAWDVHLPPGLPAGRAVLETATSETLVVHVGRPIR